MLTRRLRQATAKPTVNEVRTTQTSPFAWSGYTWSIRPNYASHGPGSNAWSNQNVEIDQQGRLYLSLVERDGVWTCVEVAGPTLGYGRYDFYLESDPTDWDRRPVLGLFTYDDNASSQEYREIDIEVTKWSNPLNTSTVWYTMNPIAEPNQSSHQVTNASPYRCSFVWQPGQVYFETTDRNGNLLGNHLVNQGVFGPGTETIRLNLWIYRTSEEMAASVPAAPADGQPLTVCVSRFEFTPNATFQLPATSSFSADFTSGQQDGFDMRYGAAVQVGQLVLPCNDTNAYRQSVASTGAIINLTDEAVAIKVTSVPGVGNRSTEGIWQLRHDSTNYVSLMYADGKLICRKRENGVFTDHSITYNATNHRYWRISEQAGQIIYSVSADFVSWTTVHTMPHAFGTKIELMRLRFACGYHSTETSPAPFMIDSINLA